MNTEETVTESIELPDDIMPTSFPSTYYAEVSQQDFHRQGGKNCPSVMIKTNVSVQFTVKSRTEGHINVGYFTHDIYGNVKDTAQTYIESDIKLGSHKPLRVNKPGSKNYFILHWAVLNGGTATSLLTCYNKYSIKRNGKLCHSSSTSGKHRLTLSLKPAALTSSRGDDAELLSGY